MRLFVSVVFLVLLATPAARADTARPIETSVCVQPLGPHDRGLLRVAIRGIRFVYGFHVRKLNARPLPKMAWYQPRRRFRAEKLLTHLKGLQAGSGCDLIVGFTSRDISTSVRGHRDWGIFGLGTIGGPSSVVSTHRLKGKARRRRVEQRTVKVVGHELGHTLGIPHVVGSGCLMQDAMGSIRTVDGESGLLCDSTRRRIERLQGIELPRHEAMDWATVLGPGPR